MFSHPKRAAPAALALALILASQICAADFVEITPDKHLTHWIAEGAKEFKKDGQTHPVWSVDDDVLTCRGNGFGFLRYDQKVCDFVLRAEYKMAKGCNSGLGIRTVEYDSKRSRDTRPSYACYEIQILDDAGKQPGKHSSMSLYRYVAPTVNAVKPADEWNQIEVSCQGPKIRITLNGEVVQDVDQSTIDEIKDKPLCGYISLQNHGKRIEWRNLELKVLEPAANEQ